MMNVRGKCPKGCGDTLFLGDGGYVTCSFASCPDPSAASDLLVLGVQTEDGQRYSEAGSAQGEVVLAGVDSAFSVGSVNVVRYVSPWRAR